MICAAIRIADAPTIKAFLNRALIICILRTDTGWIPLSADRTIVIAIRDRNLIATAITNNTGSRSFFSCNRRMVCTIFYLQRASIHPSNDTASRIARARISSGHTSRERAVCNRYLTLRLSNNTADTSGGTRDRALYLQILNRCTIHKSKQSVRPVQSTNRMPVSVKRSGKSISRISNITDRCPFTR